MSDDNKPDEECIGCKALFLLADCLDLTGADRDRLHGHLVPTDMEAPETALTAARVKVASKLMEAIKEYWMDQDLLTRSPEDNP